MQVVLHDPAAAGGGPPPSLGISHTLVHIVDNDGYPQRCPAEATPLRSFFFFILERFQQRQGKVTVTGWCFVYKAFHEVIVTTFALVFFFRLVKEMAGDNKDAADGDEADERRWTEGMLQCGLCVFGLALSTFIYMYCDFEQLDKRGRSGTRKDLRRWIIKRYLQLSDKARKCSAAEQGHVHHTAVLHVEEVVNRGWFSLFLMLEGTTALIFILCMSAFLGGPIVLLAAFVNVMGVAFIVSSREVGYVQGELV